MINAIFDKGALPVLERVTQFTHSRHKVLTHNVANLSTPYFQPSDLDRHSFQSTLRDAIDQRRHGPNPMSGPLSVGQTEQLRFDTHSINADPRPTNDGILFHDRNNRDLERIMQHLAENAMTHNAAIEMIRNEFSILRSAIREQV